MTSLVLASLLVAQQPKLVSIVWDGAADWVVDEMLAAGELPNVARLKANGVSAQAVIPGWPSKTAVGHAAIFTGTWMNMNGISNNSVGLTPRESHDLSESISGFNGTALKAEPIWVTAALAGRKVVACSAATSFPVAPFVEQIKAGGGDPKNFVEFSGFETTWSPGKMFKDGKAPFTSEIADKVFKIRPFDDPSDPVKGFDSVGISLDGRKEEILKPKAQNLDASGWSQPYLIEKDGSAANAYFRLWSLKPTGEMELYQRKVSAIFGTESPETIKSYVQAYGGFHDDEFSAYERGLFGKTIWQEGDGSAEDRLLEIVKQDCDFLKRGFAYAWKTWQPDLLFHYTPMSDSAGHTWMGAMDPDTATDPVLREKLWKVYKKVLQLQDEWLGFIIDSVGGNTVVSLMSDHGMAGSRRTIYINKILEDAGLCVRDSRGAIDWTKSKAAVPAWSDFFVVVNTTDRKGGIVPVEEREGVVAMVKEAMLSARDSAGKPVITGVFRPEDAQGMGLGGPTGGDVYFEIPAGSYPSNRSSKELVTAVTSPIGDGVHGFMPYRRRMSAIFYASGPGLAKGVELPVIRHIDIMPTLCKAVGLPKPKHATGIAY